VWGRSFGLALALLATPPASADCGRALLQRLGWSFQVAAVESPQVHGGPVCTRASLPAAKAGGDLRVQVPADLSPARWQALERQLLDHPANLCAYAFELGAAARRAAEALQDNPGYRFSALQMGWIGFGWQGAAAQGWRRTASFGRGYQPSAGNARAMDAFYHGHVRSECGVGRQVAQLATQRELYGDAAFDAEFSPAELTIGTFNQLHGTDSILLGAQRGELFADGKAVRTAAMGRQAFVGVPGFIEHALGRETLDDLSNQAENFIVVDVGEQAAQALAAQGGFAAWDARNAQLWTLSRQLPRRGVAFFERLLLQRDPALRAALSPSQQEVARQMDALLDDPFYQQFLIYVHPRGIKPIGDHIVRLLDRNPRTPYVIELAMHNLHTTLYRRWQQAQLRSCAAARSGVPTYTTGPGP